MQNKQRIANAISKATEFATAPLRILANIFSLGIGLFHIGGDDAKANIEEGRVKKLLLSPIRLAAFVFNGALATLRARKITEILVVLPSVLTLGLLLFIGYRVVFTSDTTERLYFLGARRAIEKQDLSLAKRYFERIAEQGNMSDEMTHDWAVVLRMSGEEKRASELLEQLAPEKTKGFSVAHRTQAVHLSNLIDESSPDADALARLHWHLEHASPGPQTDQAWARYYICSNQPEEAIRYLNNAATMFPQLYFSLSEICLQLDRQSESIDALHKARDQFQEQLNRDSLDEASRLSLGKTLMELKNHDAAESVIFDGLQIFKTPGWVRTASDFLVWRSRQDLVSAPEKLELLLRALIIDQQNKSVFDALVELCRGDERTAQQQLKSQLLEIVTGESSTGLAHICLAFQYWQEENESDWKWHLQQARNMDTQFELLARNLAMSFAGSQSPDFDWANVLVAECCKASPENRMNRIRKAEIMLLQELPENAIEELKTALQPGSGHDKLICERLSFAYSQIGDLTNAKIYAKKANEIE